MRDAQGCRILFFALAGLLALPTLADDFVPRPMTLQELKAKYPPIDGERHQQLLEAESAEAESPMPSPPDAQPAPLPSGLPTGFHAGQRPQVRQWPDSTRDPNDATPGLPQDKRGSLKLPANTFDKEASRQNRR